MWTESAFWCGSVVSSGALKMGMCSGVDRVRIFAWTEFAFWCGSVVLSRAVKTGLCFGWPLLPLSMYILVFFSVFSPKYGFIFTNINVWKKRRKKRRKRSHKYLNSFSFPSFKMFISALFDQGQGTLNYSSYLAFHMVKTNA